MQSSGELITPQSAIEELALSIRARNALHRLGCRTVSDVLQVDLSAPVPRLGSKSRLEVLGALRNAGFRHPALDQRSVAAIAGLSRRLDRMQERIDAALRSVAKEVSGVQRELDEWSKE